MSNFERLHPAIQHHIVNSLGWRELRPFQEDVIPSILDGHHAIIIAPTAGGKTEAALFPTLSRMLSEGWKGLSVLYICPIKALLNNLNSRLEKYCTLLGRRSALWHGDVKRSARKGILSDIPDCLLTTPESLELMLISSQVDAASLFRDLRVIIVDEVHAFAGEDRGWHLLSVMERIVRLAGRNVQRLGLSATVGNPQDLVDWLAGQCEGIRDVLLPEAPPHDNADVKLDYVGSLGNAALVISRLHRGEKRLVFVDSRSRAERLAAGLRELGVTVFITHSSLSKEHRELAEHAFEMRQNCVIVATSVLELGVDIGDLDRVIQIDAPPTVASFLQRMGRTGRRASNKRNCLFLATNDEALIRGAALIELWKIGYVEPIVPPANPYHIFAQQLLALALQQRGIGVEDWKMWIGKVSAFSKLRNDVTHKILQYMLETQFLTNDEGTLWVGSKGEEEYGRKHFLELLSVFSSSPMFSILHGREELGFVDETTFLGSQGGSRTLLLGGRAWLVKHVDWRRRVAHVEETHADGTSSWRGQGTALGFVLCQAIKKLIEEESCPKCWSQRSVLRFAQIRKNLPWVQDSATTMVLKDNHEVEWWTFAGSNANGTFSHELGIFLGLPLSHDAFVVKMKAECSHGVERALEYLRSQDVSQLRPAVNEEALEGLKFSTCLPRDLATDLLRDRLSDKGAVENVIRQPVTFFRS